VTPGGFRVSDSTIETAAKRLAVLSTWIDDANAHRDPEAATWGRVAKVAEYVGATGQNPRKGVQGCVDDVVKELLDVAVTALAAVEHFNGNDGGSLAMLAEHIDGLVVRAGLAS
jgi:hypothetical protein